MATLTIKLSGAEKASLRDQAQSRGMTLSALVREALGLREAPQDDRLEDFERRLARLEEMAGL